MSLLVDIAEKAHVSVEGVVRVLTREPVSDAIKERVLAVLDELDAEQTRVLQRFALAALHDVLPRPYEAPLRADADVAHGPEYVDLPRALLPPGPEPEPEPEPAAEQVPAPADAAHLVQLSAVLEELAGAVRDLRQETDTERRERVDDLAVLIELISTGWQGLDRRLGRLERQLGRLEAVRPEAGRTRPAARASAAHAPAHVPVSHVPEPPRTPAPVVETPPAVPPVAKRSAKGGRDRLPLAAALALVGVVVGAIALLPLVSGDAETAGVPSVGGNRALVDMPDEEASTPTAPTTTSRQTTSPRATPPPGTTAVLGTEAEQPPATPSSGFQPTRNWAWAAVTDADYYSVQFLRDGANLYRRTTRVPRLTLPDSVEFTPGLYRWIVRPGFGSPSDARLGSPTVDSAFTVSG